MNESALVISKICKRLTSTNIDDAREIIKKEYPFKPSNHKGRKYSERQKTKIFIRDGFIDRYTGKKLIFPPVLRVISSIFPDEFPFHKNWKISECHIAYWHLCPTIDHIIPVSRGGEDCESNWVSTSQLRNSAKSNWLMEELGWSLIAPGNIREWDGLFFWFIEYIDNNTNLLKEKYFSVWYHAALEQKNI